MQKIVTNTEIKKALLYLALLSLFGLCVFIRLLEIIFNKSFFVISFLLYVFIFILITYNLIKFFKTDKEERKIINKIEKNLKSLEIYFELNDDINITPKVRKQENKIVIEIPNIEVAKKLERNKDYFTTALPNDWTVLETYFSRDGLEFILIIQKQGDTSRIILSNINDFFAYFDAYKPFILPLDKNFNIDIRENAHILIQGRTGGGKSYYSQLLAVYALFKDYEVVILDFKQSYSMFEDYCSVSYSAIEIHEKLLEIRAELEQRKKLMKEHLKNDGTLLAADVGFKPYLIIFEEYLGLMNSATDKKILQEIEKIILEIVSQSRALSIHLVLVLQVALASSLSTAIRSNMLPLVFGSLTPTINETAFGIKSDVKVAQIAQKGQGFAKFDINVVPISAPTLLFPIGSLLSALPGMSQRDRTGTHLT